MSHATHRAHPAPYAYGGTARLLHLALAAVGLAGFVAGLLTIEDSRRFWFSVLIAYSFLTFLGAGAAFIQAVQYVSNAAWGVSIRRVTESMANLLVVSLVLFPVVVWFGRAHIWNWMDPSLLEVIEFEILEKKASYLNLPFFLIRGLVILGAWTAMSQLWMRWSRKQDETGDEKYTVWSGKLAAGFLFFFAPTICLFGIDLLMTLDVTFFSTMFGVYVFVGSFQSAMALLALLVLWHRRPGGILEGWVSAHNLHDLGKFLFGLTVFWAYIGFGQLLIIWYANIPEETIFYLRRWEGGWSTWSLALLAIHFVVPFLFLLPRGMKRTPATLAIASIWILTAQAYDLYWLVVPNLRLPEIAAPSIAWTDFALVVGALGVVLLVVHWSLSRVRSVPINDPRLEECVHLHQ